MQTLDSRVKQQGLSIAEGKGEAYFSHKIGKVELHRLSDDFGIDRIDLRDMDGDAITIGRPDGGYTLFLNSTQPRIRHRFSVAHELAHLILSPILGARTIHRRRFSKGQDPFGDQVEYLCNEMASAILMPSSRIESLLVSRGYSARCVPEIAKSFDTSFEAASRRFVQLNSQPCGLVIWRPAGSGGVTYPRNTIWNKPLGFCTIRFDERQMSEALMSLGRDAIDFVSSSESVTVIRGRGVRSTRRNANNVAVESFSRRNRRRISENWSFVRLSPAK